MRRVLAGGLALVCLAALGCGGGGGTGGGEDGSDGGAIPACTGGTIECEVLALVNAERAAQSPALPPLGFSTLLQDAALFHNDWMVANGCFAHVCGGEAEVPLRIAQAGYSAAGWAETIAAGYPTPEAVVAGWMGSPGHRAILLGDFSEVGIAYTACPGGCAYGAYWTADFANPQ